MSFVNPWYSLGRSDARDNRYPLYAVLVVAGRFYDAREYAQGWEAVTKCKLSQWRDESCAKN